MKTRIILVRHGQTIWNVEQRFRGQADIPLDEVGLRQADATGAYVASRWAPTAIYASPLQRALQTAQAIADVANIEVTVLDDLLDIDFGELRGLSMSQASERYPEVTRSWLATPESTVFPGGESLDDVRERASRALDQVADRHQGETVALVAHTVLNRAMLCSALELGHEYFWRLEQDTCAVNLIIRDGKHYLLALMNDTSHLWQNTAL